MIMPNYLLPLRQRLPVHLLRLFELPLPVLHSRQVARLRSRFSDIPCQSKKLIRESGFAADDLDCWICSNEICQAIMIKLFASQSRRSSPFSKERRLGRLRSLFSKPLRYLSLSIEVLSAKCMQKLVRPVTTSQKTSTQTESEWPLSVLRQDPVAASYNRTVSSSDATSWPSSMLQQVPVAASYNRSLIIRRRRYQLRNGHQACSSKFPSLYPMTALTHRQTQTPPNGHPAY
jgi:hypothetical protein